MTEPMQRAITILVVDDHALFRESVARLLGAEPGFEVVTPCGSVEEALKTAIMMAQSSCMQRNSRASPAECWL
jgi:DNA-binding NarL/FixJ family response regulator